MEGSILIIISLFLFSCQQKPDCNLDSVLFPNPKRDSSQILNLDDVWEYSDSIEQVLCNTDPNEIYLNVEGKAIQFHMNNLYACYGFICVLPCRGKNRIDVLINKQNQILFENQVVSKSQLDSLFIEQYLNFGKNPNFPSHPKRLEVSIKWDLNSNREFVENVLQVLTESYSKAIKSLFKVQNEQEMCIRILNRQDSVLREFPFRFSLSFGKLYSTKGNVPQPPPPNWVD